LWFWSSCWYFFGAVKPPTLSDELGQAIRSFKNDLGQDNPADSVSPKQITDRLNRRQA
jgi:Sec-independent protein translocase protein TatA